MTLIASIITFSKKKIWKKKCYPRHGTLADDMEPSTLDPRQKDRLIFFTAVSREELDCVGNARFLLMLKCCWFQEIFFPDG